MSLGLLTPNADHAIDAVCPVNWLDPLNRGLVSWWLCVPGWTGGSKWQDLCGRNHGTLTNMNPATDWVGSTGRLYGFGELDFDAASSNYVAIAVDKINFTAGKEFGFFAYCRLESGANYAYLAGAVAASHCYIQVRDDTNAVDVRGAGGTVFSYAIPSPDLTRGNWVMVTRDTSNNVRVYWDGVESTTGAQTITTGTDMDALGHAPAFGAPITTEKRIDDVRYYDRLLSAPEIWQLTQESRSGWPRTLNRVRRWGPLNSAGAPPATNRRRRLIIAGGTAA